MNIRELAAKLRLSASTVSKALNGRQDVSQETRKRVLEAAERLGFSPVPVARRLRRQSTETIAFAWCHRRIALVHASDELMFSHLEGEGYKDALRGAGIRYDKALNVEAAMTEEGGAVAARRLLALPDPPTAIVCGHDLIAIGVMRAIAETGRVPGRDVGVIGGDNHPFGRYLQPALTTFSADTHRAGKRMAELLLGRLAGTPARDLQEAWAPELIVRASDGPHRSGNPDASGRTSATPKRPRALTDKR